MTIVFVRVPKKRKPNKGDTFSRTFSTVEEAAGWFYSRWPKVCIYKYVDVSVAQRVVFLKKVTALREKSKTRV